MIIDPPSPFAPLSAWVQFLADMRATLADRPDNNAIRAHIEDAERMIAERG